MPNRDKKTDHSNLLVLVAILIIGAVAYFFLNPTINSLKDLNIKLGAKTEEIKQMQSKLDTLRILEDKFNQFQDQVKKLGLAVPSDDQIPEIMVQLQALASESGLTLMSIQPAKETKSNLVSLHISLQGDYNGLEKFITVSEKNIRPINIKSINLAAATKEEQGAVLNFTLGLEMIKIGSDNEQK